LNLSKYVCATLNFRSYCSKLGDQQSVVLKIKECLQRKEFKHYSGTTEHEEVEHDNTVEGFVNGTMNIEFLVGLESNTTNVYEEILIVDDIGLVGSLGGSFGLFVGFSFFGYLTPILDAMFEKVADFFNL
jgi:hypothetical protein